MADVIKALKQQREQIDMMVELAMNAVKDSVDEHVRSFIQANITDEAVQKEYLESFSTKKQGAEAIILSFEGSTQRITGIEEGFKSFSIKDAMLQGPNVKTSKAGHKYRVIPLDKQLLSGTKLAGSTGKEQKVQDTIRNVLKNANFSFKSAITQGGYTTVEKSDKGGLMKISQYPSIKSYYAGERPKKTNLVLFRVMSNKPGSAQWQHPGSEGKQWSDKIEAWYTDNKSEIFAEILEGLQNMLGEY